MSGRGLRLIVAGLSWLHMTISTSPAALLLASPVQGPQWSFDSAPEYPPMHPLAGTEAIAWSNESMKGAAVFAVGGSVDGCENRAQRDGWVDAEWDALQAADERDRRRAA